MLTSTTCLLYLSLSILPSLGFLISSPQPPSPPSNTFSRIKTTTTAGAANSKRYSSTGDDDDADFMQSLRMRIKEVTSSPQLPLVVIDTMLPRQILSMDVADTPNDPFLNLLRERIASGNPYVGVVGTARLSSGQSVNLESGVEAELRVVNNRNGMVRVEMLGGRRFVIDRDVYDVHGGWPEASVRFLGDNVHGGNSISSAKAISIAGEFTSPNMNIGCDGSSLVEKWIELAKENECQPGQIDEILATLGEIPSAEEPSDCAFWIGALINPLPVMMNNDTEIRRTLLTGSDEERVGVALNVAMEIRPTLLTAASDEERVGVALDGLTRSIRHMDGSAPMW